MQAVRFLGRTFMMPDQKQNTSPLVYSKKSKLFNCAEHANNISKKLLSFYEKKEFFDIALVAADDNVKVRAHRIVLSASSDYFLAMFRSTMQEAKAEEVVLQEIDGGTMKTIVEFMYTAAIEICCGTVENILRVARFLQMNTLIAACCEFMEEQLDPGNCLGIAFFAEQHNCVALRKKASSFAFANFEKVCTETEFLQLSEGQLGNYLASDDLIVSSEEKVFLALITWSEYDKESREEHVVNLLPHIRFSFIKPKFIIENTDSVCKTIESYKLICSWLRWHLSPGSRLNFSREQTRPRTGNRKLAVANGKYANELKVQTFDPQSNSWSYEELPIQSKKICDYSATVINAKLIIAGGKIEETVINSVESLDLETKKWSDLPEMKLGRTYPGIAELKEDLYVVGGCINGNWSHSVEKYDFSTREWHEVASLHSQFEWIKVAVHDGFLYAVGSGSNTMECFDPTANQWTQKSFKKLEKLEYFNMVAVNEYLYIVGGTRDGDNVATVERYHPFTDTWVSVRPLKKGRNGIRCTGWKNRLIAFDGYSNDGWEKLVEEYNPETNEWITLPPLLEYKVGYYYNTIFPM